MRKFAEHFEGAARKACCVLVNLVRQRVSPLQTMILLVISDKKNSKLVGVWSFL